MADPNVAGRLRGRSILLVHEDAFVGHYLGDVIGSSGGLVVGPVASGRDGAAALAGDPGISSLVLSDTAPDREIIVSAADARALPMLIVRSPRAATQPLAATAPVLTAPFAAFQVVQVLALLLGDATAPRPGYAGPSHRGH